MSAYYNEIDPKAAAWLRELIKHKHIADGDVDERSISDVTPADLGSYTQCHFFAGIGGWSLALRLAGWPDDRPVWTGSCPCQPFSAAGRRGGVSDERHLWPHWHHLIHQCRPATVFGEQVASRDGLGWLDLVSADMEATGYALAAADLCAAGLGAPHIRQRLWFVGLADADGAGRDESMQQVSRGSAERIGSDGIYNWMGNANHQRPQEHGGLGDLHLRQPNGQDQGRQHIDASVDVRQSRPASQTNGHWADADWLFCRDGQWRPVEPGTQPLAHGLPARVGRLRGYGNAIVPQVAAEIIKAVIDQ